MKENRVSNEFRQGREATFAALLMELCLCGERIAFCYYYIIKKPRLLDTPEWYELMKKDRVIYGMWILEMIILVSSIGT